MARDESKTATVDIPPAEGAAVARDPSEALLERIADAFFSVDREWRFTYVNSRAEALLQRSRSELLGHDVWQLFPEAVGTVFDREYRRAVDQQVSVTFEAYYPPFAIWFEVRAHPSADGLSVFFQDITARRRTEQALRRSEERFRSLVEASSQIIWTTSPEGEFVEAQPGWSAFTGQSTEELMGLGWLEAVHPDDRTRTLDAWKDAVAGRTRYELEHRIRHRDGEYRDMRVRGVPVREADGSVREWVGVNADITERRRVESRSAEQRALLEMVATDRPLAEVLEAVAHFIEAQSDGTALCSILVLDESGRRLRFGAGPSLPPAYNAAIDGVRIGPAVGSCGTAAFRRAPVVVSDIAQDPLWADYRALAAEHGLAACWSTPILTRDGAVLGTFAIYHRTPRAPSEHDQRLIDDATYLVGIALEQERSARALRQSEERFRVVQEASPDGFMLFRSVRDDADRLEDFEWLYINAAAERLLARHLRGMDGQRLLAVLPGVRVNGLFDDFVQVVESGGSQQKELRYRQEGVDRWLRITAVKVGDGIGVTISDITVRRQLEREREELLTRETAARHEAEAANQSKSGFLATMSHEIRTPINAIVGYTELLEMGLSGPLTEEQRTQLERIRSSSRHLLGLVNEVLDLAKVESGQLAVRNATASASEAVDAALALVRPQATARGLNVTQRCLDSHGALFIGDEDRVRQILVNLLSNSVKFTEPGGELRVTCGIADRPDPEARLSSRGSWAFVRVEDTGIGIPPEKLSVIFDPFVQAETGHTRTRGGTGLGLTISRRLARLMHGDLTVRSEPGKGSSFTLWLVAAGGGSSPEERDRSAVVAVTRPIPMLAVAGTHLLHEVNAVVDAFVARLRDEPLIPAARHLRASQLADHTATLLVDIAETLLVMEELAGETSPLLTDGTAIQRVIAERHGAQRGRLGWTDDALAREYVILRDEAVRAIRRHSPADDPTALDGAVMVLVRLLEQAEYASLRSMQRSGPA